jgi:hypothetical protein
MTDDGAETGAPAPEYATSMRDALAEPPSETLTVDPAVPATAVRVNTHDRMSGLPSDWVPRSVQPAGVVAVVAELVVSTYTSWSPTWTDAGTVMVGVAVLELADEAARNEGGAADAVSGAAAETNTPTSNDNTATHAALNFNMLRQLSALLRQCDRSPL